MAANMHIWWAMKEQYAKGDWQLGRIFYRYQSKEDVPGGAGKSKERRGGNKV